MIGVSRPSQLTECNVISLTKARPHDKASHPNLLAHPEDVEGGTREAASLDVENTGHLWYPRRLTDEALHMAASHKQSGTAMMWLVGCGGCLCLIVVALLITVLASIKEMGPNEQLLVKSPSGHWTKNGPWSGVLINIYPKEIRKATLLKPDQYAVVKDEITGTPRHESGPQLLFLNAYDNLVAVKTKVTLHKDQFARVKNEMTGVPRNEEGPQLFFPGVYDEIQNVEDKIVLQKDYYVVLVDQITGAERVVRGPQTIVPAPLEVAKNGSQRAIFLDTETAVLILNRSTGKQHLVQENAAYVPGAYQEIVEVRKLIHVLPHEAVVVRDHKGELIVHSGAAEGTRGTAFFLPPYSSLLTQHWSDYSTFSKSGGQQKADIIPVTSIDLRPNKMLFQYEVRTSDNVKLVLEGTLFWQVKDIAKMINSSPDPESDVWHHARSSLIQAISDSTLSEFMANFNTLIKKAWDRQSHSSFYVDRGVELQSMELTRFDCVDEETAAVLQEIIQETTNRINRLTAQESENEVRAAKMTMDITLERQRTELIQTQSDNDRLQKKSQGEADGSKMLKGASTYISGLSASVPSLDSRLELYRLHEELKSRNVDTKHLASGNAQLFLTPSDVNLKLNMKGGQDGRRQLATNSGTASLASLDDADL